MVRNLPGKPPAPRPDTEHGMTYREAFLAVFLMTLARPRLMWQAK